MHKISVIVPVYNVEKYLEKCVESIIAQTYSNLEIILVDDGATDSSGLICDRYAENDKRIKVIHKENGGLSSARNAGIVAAEGEYIGFVDSDDYIEKNMIELLAEELISNDADMSVCGVYNVYQERKIPQCSKIERFVCGGEEAYKLLMIGEKIPGTVCNKLFKRKMIQQLRFPEGKLYEDAFFHINLMPLIKKVAVNTTPMYFYVHRKGSITTAKFNSRGMDVIEAYEKNYLSVKQNYPAIIDVAEFRVEWAYFVVMDRMMECDHYWTIPEYKKVKRFLKKKAPAILTSRYFRKSRRIGALALMLNIKLYCLLSRINRAQREKLA